MTAIVITKDSYEPFEHKMKRTIEVLASEFNNIRAGRANPHVLDQIVVPYYGVDTPLQQVANIQVPDARTLMVTPWDSSLLKEVSRAIQASDLGINPNNDGKCIRLSFPPLTEDRRRDLTKEVSKFGEEAKVAIRNVRREGIEKFKAHLKAKEISEDGMHDFEDGMQKLTNRYIEKVDAETTQKNKELLEI